MAAYPQPPVYPQQQQQQDYYQQAPLPPPQSYAPIPVPKYSIPIATSYEPAPPSMLYGQSQPIYQPPAQYQQPQTYYQQQQQQEYQQPAAPVYQEVPLNYSVPKVESYQQPQQQIYQPVPLPLPVPVYQPQQQTASYQQSSYQQQPQQPLNYSTPSYQKPASYVQPQPAYVPPPPQPQPLKPVSYVQPQQPQVKPYVQLQQQHQPATANYSHQVISRPLVQSKYSPNDLASMVPFSGYRANHWSLLYYRASPYRNCPKSVYLNGPTYKDIEAAFAWAQKQLEASYNNNIQYLNSTQPSWLARHQVFSFMSQKNARMDEEGLLVELVSQYLSDRACLTKWDKQRYLPQLTKFVSVSQFPQSHSCNNLYRNPWQNNMKQCLQSKYRTYDGFCNNPYHPYWGKANVCHIRLLSPDYADGISIPRNSYNQKCPLPNPRSISNYIHVEVPLEGPYNLMKMQWGQFINHDITNTALSAYDGLVDCCRNPGTRGCWPIYVPTGDKFYGGLNVTCLNFIRSGVCPTCQLGPRQQINKNSAFLDASHVYGQNHEQANSLRAFKDGKLRISVGKTGDQLLPIASGKGAEQQCSGSCFLAGDSRVNQHPALTVLHTLLLRSHNKHARELYALHNDWNDEIIYQEARRLVIAEYQMITFGEYFPIVFGPILSAYYHLIPQKSGYTYYQPKADPTTWNEYSTATCRFGHSQIQSTFGLYHQIAAYGQQQDKMPSFRLKDWFMRPTFLNEGLTSAIVNGLVSKSSGAVDPWITNDVRNHLYQSHKEFSGGDLAATNIWRGRDHGLPGYVHYVEYCFNYKVRTWKDLSLFIPYYALNQLKKIYRCVENIDLFTGGMAERHFPGADTGPTFACVNGIQYYHLKFGDRYYFEHGGQSGSFNPVQLDEIKRTTLARLLCRTANIKEVPQYAFLSASQYNPLVNCSMIGEIDYKKF